MLIDKLLMHLYLKKHRLNALHVQKTHRVSEGYRVTKVINKIEAVLTAISLSSPFPLNFSSSKKPLYIYQYIVPHLSASLNSSFFNFIIIIFSPLYVKNKIFENLCICANQMRKSMWDKLKSPFTRSGEFF